MAALLERVRAADRTGEALPEDVLARHEALKEKQLALAAEPRLRRRGAGGAAGAKKDGAERAGTGGFGVGIYGACHTDPGG